MLRNKGYKISAAKEPLDAKVVLAGLTCIVGFILMFFDLPAGVTVFLAGFVGWIASRWARDNRDSPWVHGLDVSGQSSNCDPRIKMMRDRPNPKMMRDKDLAFEQALDYKRLLDNGLISSDDYQVAMKRLFPHLPSPNKSEQGVAPQSATRPESDSEGDHKPKPESEARPR